MMKLLASSRIKDICVWQIGHQCALEVVMIRGRCRGERKVDVGQCIVIIFITTTTTTGIKHLHCRKRLAIIVSNRNAGLWDDLRCTRFGNDLVYAVAAAAAVRICTASSPTVTTATSRSTQVTFCLG